MKKIVSPIQYREVSGQSLHYIWINFKIIYSTRKLGVFLENGLFEKKCGIEIENLVVWPMTFHYQCKTWKAKEKYRGMFDTQRSGDRTSSGEISFHEYIFIEWLSRTTGYLFSRLVNRSGIKRHQVKVKETCDTLASFIFYPGHC